jgi:predicted DCC family thiol-disulfide oxidoreductase YuxK
MHDNHPVMLYDGVCKFCNGAVQWVLRNDSRGAIHFAPLQSSFARDSLAKYPEFQEIDSVILLEPDGHAVAKSEAVLRIARYVGGLWRLLLVGRIFPRPVRDIIYDFVARNRYRMFGKHESCMRPSKEHMARFVDTV